MRRTKTYITNMWRRYRYYIFYLSVLFFMYTSLTRLFSQKGERVKSSVKLQYVTVHFDLKGSPPKLSYIESLLPILNTYGVNAILVEYEDMFPYKDSIVNISAVNCYKRSELLRFINYARDLDIEIIPLIQTFGHMEFVLKHEQFAHLREQANVTADICPSNPTGRELITTMLKQVIDLHSTSYPLRHIHVGCDEVFNINKCPKCKERRLETLALFAEHVEEVTSIVRELSPPTNVLIWSDMLYHQIKLPQKMFPSNVEAVAWEYRAHAQPSHKHFYDLHQNFNSIWIASAFKGADGRNATIPNIKRRFQNHLSWIKFILNYKFGGESEFYNFKGIILTGWSRYSHMSPQCELLPIAMPSLILNLLLIGTAKNGFDQGDLDRLNYCEFFQKYLSHEFLRIFRSYNETDEEDCAFENTYLYTEHGKLFDLTLLHNCLSNLHRHELECHKGGSFVDTTTLERSFKECRRALKKLSTIKRSLESLMVKYYRNLVIKSYVDETVQIPAKKIKKIMYYLKNCTKNRF